MCTVWQGFSMQQQQQQWQAHEQHRLSHWDQIRICLMHAEHFARISSLQRAAKKAMQGGPNRGRFSFQCQSPAGISMKHPSPFSHLLRTHHQAIDARRWRHMAWTAAGQKRRQMPSTRHPARANAPNLPARLRTENPMTHMLGAACSAMACTGPTSAPWVTSTRLWLVHDAGLVTSLYVLSILRWPMLTT